ncbi:unnamed protein product [Penicillium olsonii]|uniref:Mei2-like C-terminal RNA recognition motif domain-containing protein n=1 Tax=Penicillium olsonii TaxID=99116 RepID=A0A9W4MUS0_PENOL|nr:unnamed protein product [Penicillium olsonii]CAG8115559.1 unnamed protein product [Penicillium olsonii]CAG8236651.1 unnamed protein product [Penicillium olsonii]
MAEPPIRGSPSKQLLAFDPQSSDPAVRRASTLPGMQAHGARVDPFANWTDQLQLSGAVRDDINVAPGSAVSAVLAQNAPVVLPPLHGQLQPLPTTWDATGRYYLPSVSSLGLQDPAIRAQEIIAQSQYPFGLDHTRDENQDWYPQARYSPSQEGRVLTYNPVQAAPGITKGEHPARQAAGEDLSSAMVRAPAGIQMTAPRAPGGAVRLIPRRGIIVEGVAQETEHTNVLALFPRSRYGTLEGVFIQQLHASGRFSVVFADLREAIDAFNQIPRAYPAWNIKYATIAEVVSAGLNGPFHSMASPEDGQLVICALIDTQPPVRDFDQRTDEYVANVTEALGDVRYCNRVSEENASVREYRVEYFNVQHAIHAYSCLNHLLLDTLRFDVSLPLSVLHTQARNAGSPRSPITPFQCSPNAKMEIDPTSPELSDTIEEQHVIDLLKVERGEDLRTTVMIRNIPNKFTADTFKTILDQWVFARYDFVYLRMDFMHHCK